MNVSRRDVVVAGTLALGASGFLLNGASSAEAGDEESVARSVEIQRKALLEADRSKLEQVASAQISYGHSDGRVQNKEEFIHGAAIARHIYLSQSELDGKATITRIGALRVWQEQDGG